MAKTVLYLILFTLVVFDAEARSNVALLFCNDARAIRGDVDVLNGDILTVPADCTKGYIRWSLPDPLTNLDVQFQNQNPSYCFVSGYPENLANYAVLEDDIAFTPFRRNDYCISSSDVQLSVLKGYWVFYIKFELRP